MAVVPLNFENLASLDSGKIDKLVRMQLARAAQDCVSRPGDKSPRRVVLEFLFVPIMAEDASCETVGATVECKTKVPVYRSKPYEMRVGNQGFLFNEDDPQSVNQGTLPLD
jgi:hypothetical protein